MGADGGAARGGDCTSRDGERGPGSAACGDSLSDAATTRSRRRRRGGPGGRCRPAPPCGPAARSPRTRCTRPGHPGPPSRSRSRDRRAAAATPDGGAPTSDRRGQGGDHPLHVRRVSRRRVARPQVVDRGPRIHGRRAHVRRGRTGGHAPARERARTGLRAAAPERFRDEAARAGRERMAFDLDHGVRALGQHEAEERAHPPSPSLRFQRGSVPRQLVFERDQRGHDELRTWLPVVVGQPDLQLARGLERGRGIGGAPSRRARRRR